MYIYINTQVILLCYFNTEILHATSPHDNNMSASTTICKYFSLSQLFSVPTRDILEGVNNTPGCLTGADSVIKAVILLNSGTKHPV